MKTLRTLAFGILSAAVLAAEAGTISFANSWSTYLGGENEGWGDDSARTVLLTKSSVLVGGTLAMGLLETDEMFEFGDYGKLHVSIDPLNGDNYGTDGFCARISLASPVDAVSYAQIGNPATYYSSPVVNALATNANFVVGVGERGGVGVVLRGNSAFTEFSLLEETGDVLPLVSAAMGVKGGGKINADEIYALGLNGASAVLYRMDSAGKVLRSLDGGSSSATRGKVAFSNDGTKLYVAWGTSLLVVTDFTNMKSVKQEETLADGVAGLAVLSNGVVVATQAGRLLRYEDEVGTLVLREERAIAGNFGEIAALAADPAGRLAVAGTATTSWFKSTDGTSFAGSRTGWVEIFDVEGTSVFRSWIGRGNTALTDVSLSTEALAVSGTTFDKGVAEGGFLTKKFLKDSNCSFGFLKVWTGAGFVPDPDGVVKVDLEPKHARWSLDGGAHWLRSGTLTNLPPERAYTITFSEPAGYFPQEPIAGVSVSGVTNAYAIVYEKIPEPPVRRVINAHWVHFEFNIPENVPIAVITDTLPIGVQPTLFGETEWSRKQHQVTVYSDDSQSVYYQLDPSTNEPGRYSVSGTVQYCDENFDPIGDPFPVEGDSVVVVHGAEWRPGTLITVY